ncbi:MAG: VanZ family protein [Bacilli bacterium]|nr:VanZ family protein [Bacilli bacterium]
MSYLTAIKTAILIFPFIALIFTIPFILHQYHKYGSINKLRVLIIYSFIFYMITLYFLVILPLPDKDDVIYKENMIRLIPFSFIKDFIKETSFSITSPKTYIKSLTEPCFYTVIFNIFMTIPFGMYLRYYFKCNLKKTIIYSFILSLFFEFTQITGLYHIYKYQYRIFDVDDLILNTIGGVLGFYIMGLIRKTLPTRDEIDIKSFNDGKKVSGFRRITLFCLDFAIYIILSMNIWIITNIDNIFLVMFVIYYILIPLFIGRRTIGCKFLNIKIEYKKYGIINDTLRIIFLYLYYLKVPALLINMYILLINNININIHESILMCFIFLFFIIIYLLLNLFYLIRNNHIYYDNLFKPKYISTIKEGDTK